MTAMLLAIVIATTSAVAQPSAAVLKAESDRVTVMNLAKDSVLAIFPFGGGGGGSGVVISPDGYALTNFHVVMPCGPAMQCGMADGRVYDAVIVGIDPTGDVALIQLLGRNDFPCATLGDSDRVRTGDWVFAMGNPFLLATDMQPTVTYGIVSGVHRYQFPSNTLLEYTDCLQIDASINPGNSGGPLFNAEGQLIGINGRASFEKRGRVNVGAAYAISINQIKNFRGVLGSGRIVDHATLGATVGFDSDGRVVVTDILETSDAYRRGLRFDDEIIRFGGRPITTPNGFKNVLGIFPKDWRVPLSYRRDGQRHDILVRLAGMHTPAELAELLTAGPPTEPMPMPKPGEKPKDAPKKPPIKTEKPTETPMPEAVKKLFIERRGYANDYFNVLNRRHVWSAWVDGSGLAETKGTWTIAGQSKQKTSCTFQITNDAATLKLPSTTIDWSAASGASSLVPAESGGLLPALFLWRRLAVEGLEHFGSIDYYGTAPLPGYDGLADVLVGSHLGLECRFYFDPANGRILALELFADENADPCEIYFSHYKESNGRWMPGQIEVRYGDATFAVFEVKEARYEK